MTPMAALWRLGLSVVGAAILLALLLSAIIHPLAAPERTYTAEFTDASGLHAGADVRVRGVSVGKVISTELRHRGGQSAAVAAFTLDKRYGVVAATRVAVKYQTLTGVRYIDVIDPSDSYGQADLVMAIPTRMTVPSFDITALFNGLQPVIATLSPDEINAFTQNAANFLSGDGAGLAPVLDSIRQLTAFVADRQQVMATLMRNLAEVADGLGGHSKDLIQIIDWANRPIDAALTVLDQFSETQLYGPDFVTPVNRLLDNLGIKPGIDIDGALDTAFNNVDRTMDAFKLVPAMWENIPEPAAAGQPQPCARGQAQLPATMDILLNGQRVILCNR